MIRELLDYEAKMTRGEGELLDMYRIRDRDDEDLEQESRKKLLELYEKYVLKSQPKTNPLDALFGNKS